MDDTPGLGLVPKTDLTDVLCFVAEMGYGSDVARGACAINRAVWNDGKLWHFIVNEQFGHDCEPPQYKKTRLFLAAQNGDGDLVDKWLITFKANPSLGDVVMGKDGTEEYNIPLVMAIRGWHTGIAKKLLLNGADPNSRDKHWGSAERAALMGNCEIFLLLVEEYKVKLPGAPMVSSSSAAASTDAVAEAPVFCYCLSLAIRWGNFKLVSIITKKYKVPINYTVPDEEELFSYVAPAIRSDCLRMLKMVLDLGAVVSYYHDDDIFLECAPLFDAIESKRLDMVRLLFEHGADANMPGYPWSQMTPLISAAEHDSVGIARLLLKQGANPNAALDYDDLDDNWTINKEGKTALHSFAAHLSHLGVRLMLKACANCDAVTHSGMTALLSCAQAVGARDGGAEQADKGHKITQCVACVELLVAAGAFINMRRDMGGVNYESSENSFSAVMYAVKADAPALITSLTALGSDVCLLAASGKSTLMLACELGLPDCVRAVLRPARAQCPARLCESRVSPQQLAPRGKCARWLHCHLFLPRLRL